MLSDSMQRDSGFVKLNSENDSHSHMEEEEFYAEFVLKILCSHFFPYSASQNVVATLGNHTSSCSLVYPFKF